MYQCRLPPKMFMGEKSQVRMILLTFPGRSYGPRGRENEKMPSLGTDRKNYFQRFFSAGSCIAEKSSIEIYFASFNYRENCRSLSLFCHKRSRSTLGPKEIVILGACAMTTKFPDNKICTFKIVLSWRFQRKTTFLDNFLLCPQCPPCRVNARL